MQAIFFISIFSLMLTVVASLISSGTSSSAHLTADRIDETKQFFAQVANVTLNDVTLTNLKGNPNNATNPADFIRNLSQLRLLSNGRLADPALDAWGHPIQGAIFTEYHVLTSGSDLVSVPVTGYVLVSGGPDGIVQTPIPAIITSLSALYGITVPTTPTGAPANDDIVFSFDNSEVQNQALTSLKSHMERIGSAALKELQVRTTAYRLTKLQQYQADIAAGKDVNVSSIDIGSDPNAPRFLALDNSVTGLNNRRQLGVDADFNYVERVLPDSSHFVLGAPVPLSATDPLVITIVNDANHPTPWGKPANTLKYSISVANTPS